MFHYKPRNAIKFLFYLYTPGGWGGRLNEICTRAQRTLGTALGNGVIEIISFHSDYT